MSDQHSKTEGHKSRSKGCLSTSDTTDLITQEQNHRESSSWLYGLSTGQKSKSPAFTKPRHKFTDGWSQIRQQREHYIPGTVKKIKITRNYIIYLRHI